MNDFEVEKFSICYKIRKGVILCRTLFTFVFYSAKNERIFKN